MIRMVVFGIAALAVLLPAFRAEAGPPGRTVLRVIDGDTFVCSDDTHVRMLQINTPESNECGGAWATSIHPKVVAEMLGHSQISTTLDLYSHVTPTMQRAATDALDAVLGA